MKPDQSAALLNESAGPSVARCVKLNNYWCIKKAGWSGEIAADGAGHVAFASAVEGAAVAALLLRRYYVDFGRHTALAIISRWAPAQCGLLADSTRPVRSTASLAPKGLRGTLRATWLASHSRGFVLPRLGSTTQVRRSVVADHVGRPEIAPTIAVGLAENGRAAAPITLDALLSSSANAPPSRSLIGVPSRRSSGILLSDGGTRGRLPSCIDDSGRIAAYAAKASAGITATTGGDLGLFAPDGAPTANLATMMSNMARVEIGPLFAKPALIESGIAAAFRPDRNLDRR